MQEGCRGHHQQPKLAFDALPVYATFSIDRSRLCKQPRISFILHLRTTSSVLSVALIFIAEDPLAVGVQSIHDRLHGQSRSQKLAHI